ncbi:hypothetical protein N0U24_15490 [Peribacillus frigoritolerans]|nr:hypothetical protein [Peribacillus frigoritolerans]MCT4478516.1 hypothetical protein [Peribacillus frigoritolerans]
MWMLSRTRLAVCKESSVFYYLSMEKATSNLNNFFDTYNVGMTEHV